MPDLADFTTETVRAWATCLRSQPKAVGGVVTEGNEPIALASLRTYLRTLRVFANWLPKPPHRYCEESPLRYFKLPRSEETIKVPRPIGLVWWAGIRYTASKLQRLLLALPPPACCNLISAQVLRVPSVQLQGNGGKHVLVNAAKPR